MSIEKGRWVDGRYVDGNGNEMKPPVSERPEGYKPSTGMVNGVEKKDINEPVVSVGEILEDLEKKKKDFTPSFPVDEDVEYIVKKTKDFEELSIKWRKKVFTVPVLTMIGVWIIVLYIILK